MRLGSESVRVPLRRMSPLQDSEQALALILGDMTGPIVGNHFQFALLRTFGGDIPAVLASVPRTPWSAYR
jgi:hypothetical protein